MKIRSCLAACLLFASASQAADLAEMQKMAVDNRVVVQRYVTNVEKSAKDITLARAGYYPSVDLSYKVTKLDDNGSTVEAEENSLASAAVTWNLFNGFIDKYGIESAEKLQEVEKFRLQGIRQDIQLAVALAYLNVYNSKANLKVTEDAFKTLEKVYRDGKNRFEVGLIGKNELLTFRVDYDNADIAMKAARAGLDKSVNSLSRQVGSDIELQDLHFEEFSRQPEALNELEYKEKMLTSRSEIQVLKGVMEATDSQVKAAYGEYYPKLDLVTSVSRYDDDFINGAGDVEEDEVRVALVASINLFRGFSKEASITKAKLEKRGLGYDLHELKDTYSNDLENLFIDYRVSLENVEVAKRAIEQAEENLRITQLKYDEGLERESDLLDAIANLSRAQGNEVLVIQTVFANYFQIQRMVAGF